MRARVVLFRRHVAAAVSVVVCVAALVASAAGRRRDRSRKSRVILDPGRDVCMAEDVPALNLSFPTAWTHGTFCTHPTYLRRQCCSGFQIAALQRGCPVVEPVETVLSAAQQLQPSVDRFVRIAHRHSLPDVVREYHDAAFTLLLPEDQGWTYAEDTVTDEFLRRILVSGRWVPALLLYHVLDRRWHSNHLRDNDELRTLADDRTVAVSKINKKMVLFNCVPTTQLDLHARDGMVHVLTKPLPPAYLHTLADVVLTHPALSLFASLVGYADLMSWVRTEGPLTMLAPTNSALRRLPRRFLDSITYDVRYFEALQAMVKNHLVRGRHCFLELQARVRVETLAGHQLPLLCSASAKLAVGDSNVTRSDLVVANGVIHFIDMPLLPSKAMSLVQVARQAGARRFIELTKRSGLFDDLVSFGPYTVFAPSDEALSRARLGRDFLRNETALRDLVTYHVALGSHASFTLRDNDELATRREGGVVRVKILPKTMTVEDGLVINGDNEAFNGYVHVVDRVLRPPVHTLARALAVTRNLTRFNTLVTKGDLSLLRELGRGRGPYTLLAVPDEDMDRWASDLFTYYRILHDQTILNQTLNVHLLDDFVMPRGLLEGSHTLLYPRGRRRPRGYEQPLRMVFSKGQLSFDHASVTSDYVLCTNGILLFVDSILLP
ncbi:transforming growth factor-beta-induced protein ig-h3-like isoform X2 [Oratosquilla oratoria]|uniref:transforming growth factor-beta-induced protein ig-h3-like isoform X2 n=1 Tax=Oratosquilla oratoria TaxID=337810 RepID=UPI003F757D48